MGSKCSQIKLDSKKKQKGKEEKRNQNFIYANKITQVIIVLDERCSISWIFLCTNCLNEIDAT